MDQDEEVLLQGSALHEYLLKCNYDDDYNVEKAKHNDLDKSTVEESTNNHAACKCMQRNSTSDSYKSQVLRKCCIECILKSSLMYEDDVLIVQTTLSSINNIIGEKSKINGHLVGLVTTLSISGVICHKICSKLKLPVLTTIVIMSPFVLAYSINQLLHLFNTNNFKFEILTLLENMKKFSLLFVNTLKFIKEWELRRLEDPLQKKASNLLCALKQLEINGTKDDDSEAYNMLDLRHDMLHCCTKMMVAFKSAVFKIIKLFPLEDYIDRKCLYISRLSDEELGIEDNNMLNEAHYIPTPLLQKMKYLCLLMQSELLRRICMSLIFFNVEELHKDLLSIIMDVKNECCFGYDRLHSTYRMHYYYYNKEEHDGKWAHNVNKTTINWNLRDLSVDIHSLSNHLRWMLIQSSEIEELIQTGATESNNDQLYQKYYNKLHRLSECYNREGKYIVDVIIDRVARLRPQQFNDIVDISNQSEASKVKDKKYHTAIHIDSRSDFTPKLPDQVFIGKSNSEEKSDEIIGYVDQQQLAHNNLFYSKPLIQELKIALKCKHEEWKEREKMALVQSNIDESSDEEIIISDQDSELSSSSSSLSNNELQQEQLVKSTMSMSLANEIANASKRWVLTEECYTQDNDNDNNF